MTALTTAEIAQLTHGRLEGPDHLAVTGAQTVDHAAAGDLTFIGDEPHARRWADCRAVAALVDARLSLEPGEGRALIFVDDVDLALAPVLERFAPPPPLPPEGVDPTAVIDRTATLGARIRIGPHVVVGPGAAIGEAAVLHASVNVMADATVGAGSVLWPGVVVRERCEIGAGCILHPNVVIGADGFGYRPAPDGQGLVKIPQIGAVRLGDGVEIGAGACVDRAKVGLTELGDGCKIDNLVQIGHNCRLGRCVVIAGQTGVSGSVSIGDGVMIGGACDIKDHVTIGAGAKLAGGSQLMNDIPPGETWAGSPAREARLAARVYVAVEQLPDLTKRVKKLERGATRQGR